MQIDFISDVICPWCFIGKRRLARAMAMRPSIPFDVKHRPYRLDPNVPRTGRVDRQAYLAARFPDAKGLAEAHQMISREGAGEGIMFAWNTIQRTPNSIDAHRLIRAGPRPQGVPGRCGRTVVRRLFREWRGYRRHFRGSGRHRRSFRGWTVPKSPTFWKATPTWRRWSGRTRPRP